jgi:PleD family two-component response regulator
MTVIKPPFEDKDLYQPASFDSYRMQRPLNADEVEAKRLDVPIQDVLVVEDSPSCIESLEKAIRTVIGVDGFHVTQDWENTVDALNEYDYDLILLDKNIPETPRGDNEMNAYAQATTIPDRQTNVDIIGTSSEGGKPADAIASIDKAMNATEDLHDALAQQI